VRIAARQLRTAKKRDGVSCEALASSRETEPVGRRCANRDAIRLRTHGSGQPSPHLGSNDGDPGPLPHQNAVRVHKLEASFADDLARVLEKADRGRAVPGRSSRGEELADVAEPGCPQQSVDQRVCHDIGVRVPGEPRLARELDAPQHQPAT
jgi:hypothetical protein